MCPGCALYACESVSIVGWFLFSFPIILRVKSTRFNYLTSIQSAINQNASERKKRGKQNGQQGALIAPNNRIDLNLTNYIVNISWQICYDEYTNQNISP